VLVNTSQIFYYVVGVVTESRIRQLLYAGYDCLHPLSEAQRSSQEGTSDLRDAGLDEVEEIGRTVATLQD